ncbi:MAG: ParB N-terminal domain-containing protein [Myxococcaceae bacterium]
MGARKAAAPKKPSTRKPRRKKVAAGSKGLDAIAVSQEPSAEGQALANLIKEDGGYPLATYREPLGGHTIVFASLPIEKVEPTPFQRDVSLPHVKRLATAMERLDRYLDPMITIRKDGKYWSPNGNHRLNAARMLGAKSVIALVLPEEDTAYQILALNTEKAHNLKERSLEVIRMYRGLVGAKTGKESEYSPLFEEPPFITFGVCYEQRPRYSAGAYNPIVKRIEKFLDVPLEEGLKIREARAKKLLELDDEVVRVSNDLKAKGFQSPYIKNFVVARINFVRWLKDTSELEFDKTVDELIAKAKKFNTEGVKKEDIAKMGGGGGGGEEAEE